MEILISEQEICYFRDACANTMGGGWVFWVADAEILIR